MRSNQRVVCSAIRKNGKIILGPRHYDKTMHEQINQQIDKDWKCAEQGFIDQFGTFLTRGEAHKIAFENGQIIRRCGGDDNRLYSENLY